MPVKFEGQSLNRRFLSSRKKESKGKTSSIRQIYAILSLRLDRIYFEFLNNDNTINKQILTAFNLQWACLGIKRKATEVHVTHSCNCDPLKHTIHDIRQIALECCFQFSLVKKSWLIEQLSVRFQTTHGFPLYSDQANMRKCPAVFGVSECGPAVAPG